MALKMSVITYVISNLGIRWNVNVIRLTIFTLHRGEFCQFLFRWIYYYGSNKFTGKETGKTHLFVVIWHIFWRTEKRSEIKLPLLLSKNYHYSRKMIKNCIYLMNHQWRYSSFFHGFQMLTPETVCAADHGQLKISLCLNSEVWNLNATESVENSDLFCFAGSALLRKDGDTSKICQTEKSN